MYFFKFVTIVYPDLGYQRKILEDISKIVKKIQEQRRRKCFINAS